MITTIGLEVHVQLKSKTKIFCGCLAEFGKQPNSNVCPVCLGLPGALPVFNRQVFELGLIGVLALGGTISSLVKFDRKNYFYPDLPKGYQISQFDHPLGKGGGIEISTPQGLKKIRINRLHLEEDAGKLLHEVSPDSSHVDLNRAGTPLAEIVSEPDLSSPEEAYEYLTHLKAILRASGVSDCDMEKGHLRCDANVSIRPTQEEPYGKRVEIKNLNSFKAVKAAIEYEVIRQAEVLKQGQKVVQETRLWDDAKEKTFSMRSKEEAHDYRYFPEPDLVPFLVSAQDIEKAKSALPELPKAKKARWMSQYGLSDYDAGLLVEEAAIADFFEATAQKNKNFKSVANWITGSVFQYLSAANQSLSQTRLSPDLLNALDALVQSGQVSLQAAKEKVFPEMARTGTAPAEIVREKGLAQVSDDSALEAWISEAIAANAKVVEDFKSGKESAAMFLVGQVMKKSGGKAHPTKVKELLLKTLKGL